MPQATMKRYSGRSKKEDAKAEKGELNPSNYTPPIKLDREVDKAADEMVKKRILPQPPGRKISFDEMQEYFKLLTPEMWTHVMVYVYRDHPKIIRQLKDPNSPRYIDCVAQAIDRDYMIEHHGGGRYSIIACDTDKKFGSQGNRLFESDCDINESQYEPKLNYEELDVNAKQNMAYVGKLQFRGILDTRGHLMPPAAPDPTPAANADMMKTALEFVREMSDKTAVKPPDDPVQTTLVNWALEQTAKGQEQNSPAALASLIKALKEVMPAAEPRANTQGSEVLAIIAALKGLPPAPQDPIALLAAAKSIFAPAEAERSDNQIDQLDKILGFAQKLGGLTRGGGAGDRNGWEIGLEYVKELATPITQVITNVMGVRGRPMPPVPPMPGAAPGVGGAFDPYANPGAMAAHSRSVAQQQPPPPPPPPTTVAPNELAGLVQAYGGLVLQHLNMGTPGHVFGDYVVGLLGNATHAQICAQGEPALVEALMVVPEIRLFGQARIEKFVNEFVHFQEFIDREEEEDEEEDAAPVNGKGKRAAAEAR